MSFIKLITEVVPKKTQVLITHSHTPLAAEIISQLSVHQHIQTIESPDPSEDFPQPDSLEVIIHLAGFGSPSLAETLSHTSVLHRLLTLALSHQAKFLLVVPNSRQHLYHTAITLVTQFAKNFSLSFQIIEVDKASPLPESAAAIIKKFVYRHKLPVKDSSHPTKGPSPLKKMDKYVPRIPGIKSILLDVRQFLLFVIVALVATWSVTIVSAVIAVVFFICSLRALPSARVGLSHACAQASFLSGKVSSMSALLAPGSSQLFTFLGIPLSHTTPVLESYVSSTRNLNELTSQARLVYRSLLSTGSVAPTQLTALESPVSQTSESLAQLQTDLRELYQASTRSHRLILSTAESVHSLHSLLSKLQLLLHPLDTQLISEDSFVTAILIQDNAQLKATGGYLEAILLLTARQGRLASVQIIPTSTADAQLTGLADSPSDYQTATGNSSWQLRDSNWDPNFSITAGRISWFLDKELSLKPDLVVAINTSIFPSLLSVTGPQTPQGLNTTFTSQNYTTQYMEYLKANSDKSPLPGLTQSIFSKSLQLSDSQINQFISVLAHGLESGQILVAPLTFSLPLSPDWSGEVALPSCSLTQSCSSDYLLPVISSLSSNKSSSFLTTSAKLDLVVAPSRLSRHYIYSLSHVGSSEWPSGDHSTYLRLYFPPTAKLDALLLNGQPVAVSDYAVFSSNGLLVVGLSLQTSPGQSSTIELRTSQDIATTSKFHYQLSLPAQPGLVDRSTAITFTYPPSWFVSTYQTPTIATPGRLEYNTPSQGHFQLNLDLNPIAN